uniref:Lysyl oxidase 2 n=1 Tax=Lygus hesperus TaxID=30085 RepID=A0A146LUF5_LYGHE
MLPLRLAAHLLLVVEIFTIGLDASKKAEIVMKRLKTRRRSTTIRLRGGRSPHEGNVEIFHKGVWGSVCDDEWDSNDGAVVCRQLGYPAVLRVTHNSQFGNPVGSYWMDNVYCDGSESVLKKCRFDGWGKNDCGPDEAAGVICVKNAEKNIENTLQYNETQLDDSSRPKQLVEISSLTNFRLRLAGGRHTNEGRVELQSGDNEWGLICGDGWSLLEANVVCRILGLGYALAATRYHFTNGAENMSHFLSNVACYGNEKSFGQCKAATDPSHNHDDMAGAICTPQLADLAIDFHTIQKTAYLEDRQMFFLQCAMEENCVASSGYQRKEENPGGWHLETRRLLRFTASSTNVGTAAFRPFIPKHLWQFHLCHMHYHSMEVFATFDIFSGHIKVAEGHKASFCLEDNQCHGGATPVFSCANYGDQGISVNCSDIYKHNIDCQWVDISDLLPGQYVFKVSINPEFKVPEMSFDNNAAICQMVYTGTETHLYDCQLTRP